MMGFATLNPSYGTLVRADSTRLWPYRRRLQRHPARTPHQKEFEVDVFRRAESVGLGAHPDQAIAQPPLQRAQCLPFQPIEWIAGRLALRDRRAGELLAPIIVVTLGAGEVELSLPLVEHVATGLQKWPGAFVVGNIDRHAAGLPPHIRREREQLFALERERRRLLLVRAAHVDSLFEIDRASARGVERGIACRNALHAGLRVAMATGA